MSILTTILIVVWGIYIINALIKKNWNNFFYGVCFLWVCLIKIPIMMEICIIILLIVVHKFIEEKEKEN
jgi:tryptophan-rich sensory protein